MQRHTCRDTYMHRDRHAERQTCRETDMQRDMLRYRKRDRQRDTDRQIDSQTVREKCAIHVMIRSYKYLNQILIERTNNCVYHVILFSETRTTTKTAMVTIVRVRVYTSNYILTKRSWHQRQVNDLFYLEHINVYSRQMTHVVRGTENN